MAAYRIERVFQYYVRERHRVGNMTQVELLHQLVDINDSVIVINTNPILSHEPILLCNTLLVLGSGMGTWREGLSYERVDSHHTTTFGVCI